MSPTEGQGDLFPQLTPETLDLYAERLRRRIARLAPALSPAAVGRVLGELALVEQLLDRAEGCAQMMATARAASSVGVRRTAPARAAARDAVAAAPRTTESTNTITMESTPPPSCADSAWPGRFARQLTGPPAWAVRDDARLPLVR